MASNQVCPSVIAMIDYALLVFPLLMIVAAVSDLLTMTIPNRIALGLAASFFGFACVLGLPASTVASHALAGGVILAVTFGLFAFGWFGGGDAKLAAATALWMGWDHLAEYLLLSTLAGGALTLLILVARRWPLPRPLAAQGWILRLHDEATGIPYGIALAGAGLLLFPQTLIWTAAT